MLAKIICFHQSGSPDTTQLSVWFPYQNYTSAPIRFPSLFSRINGIAQYHGLAGLDVADCFPACQAPLKSSWPLPGSFSVMAADIPPRPHGPCGWSGRWLAVIRYVQPVAYIGSVSNRFIRQPGPIIRNQFLREMIRTVVVGASGHRHRQSVVRGTCYNTGACLWGGIWARSMEQRLLRKE